MNYVLMNKMAVEILSDASEKCIELKSAAIDMHKDGKFISTVYVIERTTSIIHEIEKLLLLGVLAEDEERNS